MKTIKSKVIGKLFYFYYAYIIRIIRRCVGDFSNNSLVQNIKKKSKRFIFKYDFAKNLFNNSVYTARKNRKKVAPELWRSTT